VCESDGFPSTPIMAPPDPMSDSSVSAHNDFFFVNTCFRKAFFV
jgi:hypothetical protein